jgi:hypothetical protein
MEKEIKSSMIKNLKEFMITKPSLKNIIKGILHTEVEDKHRKEVIKKE